ncbi:hypothetical protein AVEN_147419-1 [Araneus ventricosus]|uniref:Uncharacterized protein n=1 Tax=Araneus ventricosus TaxID=182803 RepID=A0A4Y2DRQ9_ARAVE|nr:hypothetical protein AVEN_147419-1 [Araneus ventricosus]
MIILTASNLSALTMRELFVYPRIKVAFIISEGNSGNGQSLWNTGRMKSPVAFILFALTWRCKRAPGQSLPSGLNLDPFLSVSLSRHRLFYLRQSVLSLNPYFGCATPISKEQMIPS